MLPAATVVRPDWWIRWFLSPTRVLRSKREREDKHLLPAPLDSWLKRASEARRGQVLMSSCPCSRWLPPSNSHPVWGYKDVKVASLFWIRSDSCLRSCYCGYQDSVEPPSSPTVSTQLLLSWYWLTANSGVAPPGAQCRPSLKTHHCSSISDWWGDQSLVHDFFFTGKRQDCVFFYTGQLLQSSV